MQVRQKGCWKRGREEERKRGREEESGRVGRITKTILLHAAAAAAAITATFHSGYDA
jgi:hypothetical protein